MFHSSASSVSGQSGGNIVKYDLDKLDKNLALSITHNALDAIGVIPGFGEVADAINGTIYLAEGDYLNAGLSFVSCIPVAGDSAGKGGKAANQALGYTDDALDLVSGITKYGDDVADVAGDIAKYGDDVADFAGDTAKNIKNAPTPSKSTIQESISNATDNLDIDSSYVNLASEKRTNHILYGDKTGGGHLYPGQPGKSTFPQNWNAEKTMHEISDIATDPSLVWEPNRVVNGVQRYEVTGIRDGVEIKVITDGNDIITAFPIGGK